MADMKEGRKIKKPPKVALAHDFLANWGGAEEVLLKMGEIFPEATLHVLFHQLYPSEEKKKLFVNREVRTSFLQKFPGFLQKRKKWLLPLMPTAIETIDLRDFDLALSSSAAFSKGIVSKSQTIHICYMHSPMRYVWDWHHQYLEEQRLKGRIKFFLRIWLNYLRMWDRAAAQRPDYLLANSRYTAERIKKYYRRDCEVIYPPVRTADLFPRKDHQGFFLTVSRLSAYKKVDVLIDAFDKMNLPLLIVGEGNCQKELNRKIKNCQNPDKFRIVGLVSRRQLVDYYQNCRAFVFASCEDFGIAPVEAMAAGKPVIGFRRGGLEETVVEGVTGEFFDCCNVEMIADAMRRFLEKERKYDSKRIHRQAKRFDEKIFEKKIKRFIAKKINGKS